MRRNIVAQYEDRRRNDNRKVF